MAGEFDLNKLSQLVKKAQSKVIIVIDTNVFIENPDFRTWKTSVKNPVFLLSDRVLAETLRLVSRFKKPDIPEAEKFYKAHKAIDRLLEEGDLTDGVHIKDVGWFIAINSPSRQRLQPALDELSPLTEAHGPNDAIFLLLTRQCSEDFRGRIVVFVTGDLGLITVCNWQNIRPYNCRSLPNQGFDNWLKQQMGKQSEADWDKDFYAMIQDVKNRSVEVSLTLTSKRFLRNWLCEVSDAESEDSSFVAPGDIILAEGHGTIHMADGKVSFLWRLPFKPWASEVLAQDPLRGEPGSIWDKCDEEGIPVVWPSMKESDFDFLGRDNEVPEAVRQGLLEKLSRCEDPGSITEVGLPTLQNPISLLQSFINVHGLLDAARQWEEGYTETPTVPSPESYDYNGLRDFLSAWLSTHSAEERADFVDMVTSCWNVGHTVRTRVALESESAEED